MTHQFKRAAVALTVIASVAAIGAGTAQAQSWSSSDRNSRIVTRTVEYRFGARSHVDDLAVQMERLSSAICWEAYRNYQHNPEFRATYAEMYQIHQDSKHIHDLVHEQAYHRHRHGSDDHIAADLHDIDALFHHVEDDVEHWTPAYRHHTGYHGHHGHHARHLGGDLDDLMDQFEDVLHHLMTDYGVHSRIGGGDPPAPYTAPQQPVPVPSSSPGPVLIPQSGSGIGTPVIRKQKGRIGLELKNGTVYYRW